MRRMANIADLKSIIVAQDLLVLFFISANI